MTFICETKKKNTTDTEDIQKSIFYTSRPEYVSTVIDQVPLLIILNTSGSFPAMAPLQVFGPASASPPSKTMRIGGGPERGIHSFSEGGTRGSDSAHSDSAAVRPGHRVQPTQIQPATEICTGGHHIVCVTEEKQWQHIFRQNT